jgi:hypothetical protein
MNTSQKPTHELSVKDTTSADRGKIGVGWLHDDGSMTVKLNPCVTISYDNLRGKVLTLFPIRSEEEWKKIREEKIAASE